MLGQGVSFWFCRTHTILFSSNLQHQIHPVELQYFTNLHMLVVLLNSFILYWSEAMRRNCSAVREGYQAMHIGKALCSMRSELKMSSLFTSLFCRSYSTCYFDRKQYHWHQNSLQFYNSGKVDQPVGGPFPERAVWAEYCPGEPQTEGLEWACSESGICPNTSIEAKSLHQSASGTRSLLFRHPNREQGYIIYKFLTL